MMGKQETSGRGSGQWPIAMTLVVCAVFAAAITLRAKSDYDAHRAEALTAATTEARVAASQVEGIVATARTGLSVAALGGTPAGLAVGVTLHGVETAAAYDAAGVLAGPGTATASDQSPLSAAAQLATPGGWTGALARGSGAFAPAIAVRGADGAAVAGFLSLSGIEPPGPGRQVLVTDRRGNLVQAIPALRTPLSGPVGDVYGIPQFDGSQGPVARNATGPGGTGVIIASADAGTSGFVVHLVRDRAAIDMIWYRAALFYALLFLGPVLAGCGVWLLVRGQGERFESIRQQMREAERRLRVAIDGARCGVWDWDLGADEVFMTDRMARIFGFRGSGRFDTEDVIERMPEEDRMRFRAALTASARIGTLDIVVLVNGSDGPVHMHLRGRAATERRTPGTVRVIGVSMDVSEQRDIELKAAAAERQLRDAIESFSGPIAIWDPNRTLIVWNASFAASFGLEPGLLRIGATYEEISRAAARAVRGQNTDRQDDQAQEIELAGGTWVRLVERETSDKGLVTIGVDITALKRTEEDSLRNERQMRSMVAELERSERESEDLAAKYSAEKMRAEAASAAKSSFLANMSHELRTPLNAINGFSQMMVQQIYGPLGDTRYSDYARDILTSGTHLLDLINDVLDMAKIEAGKFTITPKPMALDDVIEQAVRMANGRAIEKQVTIETDFADMDEIMADPRAIKQIVLNLVSNAVKFTEPGGRVLVQTRAGMSDVTIRVVDTGIGIPEDHISRLGNPFEQVESEHARTNQGTGLGLALCRSFAELHGGSLQISSQIGVGTMVSVMLPRFASAQALEAA
jgi:two-component system, cell cycle sensor histidine kinase PleC